MPNRQTLVALGCISAVLAVAGVSASASAADKASIEATYRQDRANCVAGKTTNADIKTCLKEASAARYEALHGGLTTPSPEVLAANTMHRCQSQPIQDREDCKLRMSGEGTEEGSVAQGAVVREMTTVKIVPAAGPASAPR